MRNTIALISLCALATLAQESTRPELKFNGDLRARGEWYYIESTNPASVNYPNNERYSQVLRARLGATASQGIWTAGLRFITGLGLPIASNTTLGSAQNGNSFQSKPIYLDRAYLNLKWQDSQNKTPAWKTSVQLGKMTNPLIKGFNNSSEMIYGNDLSPEGLAYNLEIGNESLRLSANTGRFWAEEIANDRGGKNDKKDVFVQSQQMVLDILEPDFKLRFGAGSHYYNDLLGHVVFGDSTNCLGNSAKARAGTPTDLAKVYNTNFNLVESFADLNLQTKIPLSLSASYVRNLEDDSTQTNSAFLLGLKLGQAKKKDQMEFSIAYRSAGANSSVGFTSSPDFGLGKTNSQGTIASLRYLLTDNLSSDLIWHAYNEYGLRKSDLSETQNRLRIELNACF